MRLLFLSPYPPYPPRSGGTLRIYNLLTGLARNHDVWCLTFVSDAQSITALEPLRRSCHVVTVWDTLQRTMWQRAWTTLTSPLPDMALRNASPAYAAALLRLLTTHQFDIIQAESIEMAGYGLHYRQEQAPRPTDNYRPAALLLDEFNAEYLLQKRAALTDFKRCIGTEATGQRGGSIGTRLRALVSAVYSTIQWIKLAAYERRLLRHYDQVIVVSDEDQAALRHLHRPAHTAIVPNGVDTDYFCRTAIACEPTASPTLVFTGSLDFRPNIDAVRWFAHAVLPLVREQQPDVRFVVVGRKPAPAVCELHDGTTIEVCGDVADVRPFIASAAVYVLPMRMGGGIRLKLLEALAMQAPMVTTQMGAVGVPELRNGEHLLLADSPAESARAIVRLLGDAALCRRLGSAGRNLVQTHYDWRVIVPRLEQVYSQFAQPES